MTIHIRPALRRLVTEVLRARTAHVRCLFMLCAIGLLLAWAARASAQQGWSGTIATIPTPMPAYPGPLQVATGPGGDVVAIWEQAGLIRTSRYLRAADGWTEGLALGARASFAVPAIAVDPLGNAIAVWIGQNAIVAARYAASDGTWATAVPVAPAMFPSNPRLAMDASGNAMLVWGDGGRIAVSSYSEADDTWSPSADVSGGYLPQIAVDPAGNAILVSLSGTGTGAVQAMRYAVDSGSWSSPVELAVVSQLGTDPQIGMDATGNATAMWSGLTTGPTFVVQTARYTAATGEWGSVATLGPFAGPTLGGAELAVAASGYVIAAWSAPGGVARASRYEGSTDTWSPPTDVSVTGVGAEVRDVGIDSDGRAIALWTEADRRVRAARSPGFTTAWTSPVVISSPGLLSFRVQVATEASGTATVVWGAGLPPCPPGCYGGVQSTRWVATPTPPVVTSVSADPGAIALSFTPPLGTDTTLEPINYAYSVDDGATWSTRDPASTASPLVIGGLTDLATYVVRLRAVNTAGAGAPTSALLARPGSGSDAPTGLMATAVAGTGVTIAWTAPEVGVVPMQYVLEGGLHPGEVLASVSTGSLVPTFAFVAPSGAFYIRVHAAAGSVRSPASNEIRIFVNLPTPPSAPANLLGLVNGSGLALSWTNTFGGGAPTSLWLNVTGAVTTTLPLPMGEAFTFANVPPGTYTLRVMAANASGISPASNAVTLAFPSPCSGAPHEPTNFQAWEVGSTIFVSWRPPASGPAVTSYTVLVGGAYVGSFTTTGRTLSGAAAPGSYTLSAMASNPCGAGPSTQGRTVVIP